MPAQPVSSPHQINHECVRLASKGFQVSQLSPHRYRVEGRIDFYPADKRYHDIIANERGNYSYPEFILTERRVRPTRAEGPGSHSVRPSSAPRADREPPHSRMHLYSEHAYAPSELSPLKNLFRAVAGFVVGIVFGICVMAISTIILDIIHWLF